MSVFREVRGQRGWRICPRWRDYPAGDDETRRELALASEGRSFDCEVVKFGKSAEKHAGDGVNAGVNEGVSEGVSNVYEEIRRNPGIRTPSLVKAVGGSQASIERAIAKLKRLQKIVYRGAPKTGGYYCI